MKFAILFVNENSDRGEWAMTEDGEKVIIEADNKQQVYDLLSTPESTLKMGIQEKDMLKAYSVVPVMEYERK